MKKIPSRTRRPPADRVDGFVPSDRTAAQDAPPPAKNRRINLDGFANHFTGLGDPEHDKVYGGAFGAVEFVVNLLAGVEVAARWRGSDLGGRIVETIPDEMVREGFEIQLQPSEEDDRADGRVRFDDGLAEGERPAAQRLPPVDDEGPEIVAALDKQLLELGALREICLALKYERAYGGGAILLGVDDGEKDLRKPLIWENVRRVKHLTAFRGGWDGEVIADDYYSDPTQARYGEPSIYLLRNLGVPIGRSTVPAQPQTAPTWGFYVHESRLLIFPGVAVGRYERAQMRGWGDSIFTRVDEVLSQFGQTWAGIAHLMTDWAQGVLKMDGLAQALTGPGGDVADGGNGTVAQRMFAINLSRSIARTVLLDKSEEFSREVTPLTGIAEVLQQFALRLAAAADMPVALLFGQAPAGLNATGASDIRFFYDRVASRQEMLLAPQLRKLVRLLFCAKEGPTGGQEPERWGVQMRPLYQPTEGEQADVRLKQAQTDQIYLATGVVHKAEIAVSRFGGSKYSTETVLDLTGREELAKVLAAPPEEPEGDVASPGASPLDITPSSQGAIVKVNEARAQLGLEPLTLAGGAPDPDGALTIAEFTAKRAAVVAAAANAEAGQPDGKPKPAPAPFGGAPPKPAPTEEPVAPKPEPEAPKPGEK